MNKDRLAQEYMELSEEIHNEGVAYMSSLSPVEFCNWIIDTLNDPNSRDSMKLAVLREGAIERLEGLS